MGDAGDDLEHCPEVEESAGVDVNEIREGKGGAEDVEVRDGGARNVRFGGRGVGEERNGLDEGKVAANMGACYSFG